VAFIISAYEEDKIASKSKKYCEGFYYRT